MKHEKPAKQSKSPTTQLTMRLPTSMHAELKEVAQSKGWSLNDEINFRLRAFSINEKIVNIESQLSDMRAAIRRLEDNS